MGIILKPIDIVDDITKERVLWKGIYREAAQTGYHKKYGEKVAGLSEMDDGLYEASRRWCRGIQLYDSSKADPAAPINASAAKMKFADYIDLIEKEPTDLRIFLFDPIKQASKLLDDYIFPKDLMGGFLDKYPNMFFGGKVL